MNCIPFTPQLGEQRCSQKKDARSSNTQRSHSIKKKKKKGMSHLSGIKTRIKKRKKKGKKIERKLITCLFSNIKHVCTSDCRTVGYYHWTLPMRQPNLSLPLESIRQRCTVSRCTTRDLFC